MTRYLHCGATGKGAGVRCTRDPSAQSEGNSMTESEIEDIKVNLKFWALVAAAVGIPWFLIFLIL